MLTIHPYLTFDGNAEEAFNYYKAIFGGAFVNLSRFKELPADSPKIPAEFAEKILHIALTIDEQTILMGSDMFPGANVALQRGNNFSISISTSSENEARTIFEKLAADGAITMPLDVQFWGDLFGMVTDTFGISWMIGFGQTH